jgi:glycosyltransferase involved in cell wall biosynthesis
MKKVSVFLITYNHEKYIAQAIESIVTQKTNFEFEVVIGEDFSKDETRAICERYAAEYPNIINLLPSDKNYGAMENAIRVFAACTGEYVALCEGDDYWIDPYKLQKQADFLDAHPDYSWCFGNIEVLDEMNSGLPRDRYFPTVEKETITIEDIILTDVSIVPTATLFFRNVLPKPFPEFYRTTFSGDLFLHLYFADKGKAKYFKEPLAVYRNHEGGLTKSPAQIEKTYNNIFQFYMTMNEYLGFRYNELIKQRLFEMTKTRLIYGAREKHGLEKFRHYLKTIPNYFRYSKKLDLKELGYYHMILFFPSLLKKMKKP